LSFLFEHSCSGTVPLGTVNALVLLEGTTIQHAQIVSCLPSVIVVYDNNHTLTSVISLLHSIKVQNISSIL